MKPNTHNGFVLKYDGPKFAASSSNQISYDGFCFMGGLSNERLVKVQRRNGYTYHRIDSR
jgi:hypothetical protein